MPSKRDADRRMPQSRTQHLVFLLHVWACVPFMLPWLRDPAAQAKLGDAAMSVMKPWVYALVVYLIGRTVLAWKEPKWMRWEYVFPPIDVILISSMLYVSHRGPLSNLTMLYFLPLVQAAASLNVRWAASVGLMAVTGTVVATLNVPPDAMPIDTRYWIDPALKGTRELWHEDPLNVAFRIWFLMVISSLMTYQAKNAAQYVSEARVEGERNRLALEMHDGVQGGLIALASQLELIGKLAERDGPRAAQVAKEARDLARQSADELRFVVQRLRAPVLTEGFVPALKQYAHNIGVRHNLDMETFVRGFEHDLDPDVEQAFFRIAQEALNNIVKHSQAKSVDIVVSFADGKVTMEVVDDGCGFSVAAVAKQDLCVGLDSMQERLDAVDGRLKVESEPGRGTRLVAVAPYRPTREAT